MVSPYPASPTWPASWPAATFAGQLIGIDANVVNGVVEIRPNIDGVLSSTSDPQVVVPSWVRVPTSSVTGAFSVAIPATGVAAVRPVGWQWVGRIRMPQRKALYFVFNAPVDSTVQLRDVITTFTDPGGTGTGRTFPLTFPIVLS